jgi:hypothetical protein
MKFTEITKSSARFRQQGRCAVCDDNLNWLIEHAHHIYPDSLGGIDHVDNCAIVCEICHWRVHNDGNYRSLIVAPLSYFPYLNGKIKNENTFIK